MISPEERTLATLSAIYRFGKERSRWPNLDRLEQFRPKLGSRATLHRALRTLRNLGLVELLGHTQTARWVPTDAGFDRLRKPPFAPALERRLCCIDAAALLDAQLVPIIRNMPAVVPLGATARFAVDLSVYE